MVVYKVDAVVHFSLASCPGRNSVFVNEEMFFMIRLSFVTFAILHFELCFVSALLVIL